MSRQFLQEQLEDANVAFIYDEAVDSRWGYGLLRSLPALHYLLADHFTFPKQWRQLTGPAQYDYLRYSYELLGEIDVSGSPLVAITNQYYEDETPFSTRPLLNKFMQRSEPLAVVADHREFDPQEGQRPLHMQEFVDISWNYRRIYTGFRDYYRDVGLGCPLRDTENLFMHDNANLYRMVTGMEVSRIRSLFDVLPNGPYLPLYDVFADIFSRDREPGAAPLGSYEDIKALARWLQRRVDIERRDAMTIARDLNRAVDADESVFDATQRMRHEDMNSAAATAADIDGDVSSAHARYKHWLQERTK